MWPFHIFALAKGVHASPARVVLPHHCLGNRVFMPPERATLLSLPRTPCPFLTVEQSPATHTLPEPHCVVASLACAGASRGWWLPKALAPACCSAARA